MLAALLIATLSINNAKMFFQGGASMPNVVESVPGDSLRAGAILPEVYGTISGWLERVALPADYEGNIRTASDMKTADLSFSWIMANLSPPWTNRVVTQRFYLPHQRTYFDLWGYICDWMSYFGGSGSSSFYMFDSSTELDNGVVWPTIEWTNNLVTAISSNEWAEIWPTFECCEPDGVWKKGEPGGSARNWRVEHMLRRGGEEMGDDFESYAAAVYDFRTSKTCLDLLKEKIGDEAYALTNSSMRIDRRFLTALENALGLCNVLVEEGKDPFAEAYHYNLTHSCVYYAFATADALWTYNPSSGYMSIQSDLSWSVSNTVSTVTNYSSFSTDYSAWCGGSFESASLHANIDDIDLGIPASNLYALAVEHLNGSDSGGWVVSSDSVDGGILSYRLVDSSQNSWYIQFNLNHLSGTNRLHVGASASQSTQVYYPTTDFVNGRSPYFPTEFMWKNAFVKSLDIVAFPICWHDDTGARLTEYGGVDIEFDDSAIKEFACWPSSMRGAATAQLTSQIDTWQRRLVNHAVEHVNHALNARIGVRSDMLPLSQSDAFEQCVLSQASSIQGGPAELRTALSYVGCDTTNGTVSIVFDGVSHVVSANSPNELTMAQILFTRDAYPTNDLPHIGKAAAAARGDWVNCRAVINWRNCRFED